MRKIIIIDDRKRRQLEFLPGHSKDVDMLENLNYVENKVGNKFKLFIEDLGNSKWSELLSYDLWVFHRSLLVNTKLLADVQSLAKKNQKGLILFSGSITYHSFSQSDFPFLIMNSQLLYSEKFFPFLEKYSTEPETRLIELIYGDNWKLTYLFKYRQVLEGITYPGNPIQIREELEDILGEIDIDIVNREISNLLQGI